MQSWECFLNICGSKVGMRASLSGLALGGLALVAAACWVHMGEGWSCCCASIPALTAPVPLGVGPNYSKCCSKFIGFLLLAPPGCEKPGSSLSLTCLCCFLESWQRRGGPLVPCGGGKQLGHGGEQAARGVALPSHLTRLLQLQKHLLELLSSSFHTAFAVAEAPPG